MFLFRLISSFLSQVPAHVRSVLSKKGLSTAPPGLSALLLDILLSISDFLPIEICICLALTSRGFYVSLFSKLRGLHLDFPETQSLLLLIERDNPGLYYC